MKGFINVQRNIGEHIIKLTVHYTQIYKQDDTWRHDGKTLNITEKELIKLIEDCNKE